MYLKFDERMKPRNHPLGTVDCSSMLAGIESIEVEPIGKKFIHKFPPEALEKIRAADLDVILRFGFNILSGEILTVARYGVWSYHHGDNDYYRGGPPHFWELVEKAPLSGVILQVLTEELDGQTGFVQVSLFTTEQTTSASVNRYTPYWSSTDMVIGKLNQLHQYGWDYVKSRVLENPKRRAGIACAEIFADGTASSPQSCLESEHHYSYPHVFRCGKELLMVPESLGSNWVDLYRCIEFPAKWERERTLLEGRFVDTTIWQRDGLWWLMTTRAEPDRAGSLFLFYSESLTGDWNLHPANPVSTDIRNNRGAGNLFSAGGRLIRPSQSCCPIYGYSYSFNEITALSAERYSEKALRTVTPRGDFCAVHTYNRIGNIEVIDGAIMTPLKKLLSSGNPARSE